MSSSSSPRSYAYESDSGSSGAGTPKSTKSASKANKTGPALSSISVPVPTPAAQAPTRSPLATSPSSTSSTSTSPYSPPSNYSQYHPMAHARTSNNKHAHMTTGTGSGTETGTETAPAHAHNTPMSQPAHAAIHPHPHPSTSSAHDTDMKGYGDGSGDNDADTGDDPFSSFARDLASQAPAPSSSSSSSSSSSQHDTSASAPGSDECGNNINTMPPSSTAPMNPFVDSMLTDLYQITMCYAYWKNGTHEAESVFDLFFRKHPFNGEFTIFAGLEEVVRYVSCLRFSKQNVQQLAKKFPEWEQAFWDYMLTINTSKVRIYAIDEGTIVIPRIPLIRVEGPLAICQLIETTVLVLVNYASLIATNAARHRLAVGPHRTLLEFGLRRAQGPDGAMSASRYAYIGGFDATSNVKAATMFGIAMSGTHAHSFVVSFTSVNDLKTHTIQDAQGNKREFVSLVQRYRAELDRTNTNNGELASFIAYAQCFPKAFLALVDTYDTLESGVWNFICVALALHQCGYTPKGIRLDSGDLAYLSKECRKIFIQISTRYNVDFARLTIVASNDLSEKVLWSLREQGHEIDSFGVGTNLVTCKTQPALGCVYKLVQINKASRIKISHDSQKVTIPGKKEAYRLFNAKGEPVLDLLISVGTTPPSPLNRILCRHPFDASKRVYVTPSRVVSLHSCVWDGRLTRPFPSLHEIRVRVAEQLASFREDHLRRLNPTPYKLSVTSDLYTFMHDIWLAETPIAEIT